MKVHAFYESPWITMRVNNNDVPTILESLNGWALGARAGAGKCRSYRTDSGAGEVDERREGKERKRLHDEARMVERGDKEVGEAYEILGSVLEHARDPHFLPDAQERENQGEDGERHGREDEPQYADKADAAHHGALDVGAGINHGVVYHTLV